MIFLKLNTIEKCEKKYKEKKGEMLKDLLPIFLGKKVRKVYFNFLALKISMDNQRREKLHKFSSPFFFSYISPLILSLVLVFIVVLFRNQT